MLIYRLDKPYRIGRILAQGKRNFNSDKSRWKYF